MSFLSFTDSLMVEELYLLSPIRSAKWLSISIKASTWHHHLPTKFSLFSFSFFFFDKSFIFWAFYTLHDCCGATKKIVWWQYKALTLHSWFFPCLLLFQSYRIWSSLCCSIQANSLWIRVPAKYLKCKMENAGLQTGKSWWVARCWNTAFTCINAQSQPEPWLHCGQINGPTPWKLLKI